MQPLVSIIIVNWNGARVLDPCLRSLAVQTYVPIEILVWDNHSTDTSKTIAKKYPNVIFISRSHNYGFAQANSLAVKLAHGKYILLLNNDTVVTKNFLQSLVDVLEKQKHVGVVQPMLRYRGNPRYHDGVINSLGAYLTPTGFLYYPDYGKHPNAVNRKKAFSVYSAYGACMLTRRSMIKKLGLFDKDFFAYFEETDFCHRVWMAGYSVLCVPSLYIYHRGGVSAQRYKAANIMYHSYKNRLCSYIKNLGPVQVPKILPVHICLMICMIGAYSVTGKFEFAWAIFLALWWNAIHLRHTLQKRKHVQVSVRVRPDDAFIGQIMHRPSWEYYYYLIVGLEKYKN
jgi:GT2 family glycosyltransferase